MRADVYVVTCGGASSRTLAQKLIADGAVYIDGRPVAKASEDIPDGEHILTVEDTAESRYVGRGGLKLEAALDTFPVAVSGMTLADIGASTGGFTDCLLRRGAARVFCIDAGHGQLHPAIASDPRVRSAEGCNARYLTPEMLRSLEPTGQTPDGTAFDGRVDGAVMDVSFISQTIILPALAGVLRPGGFLISLVKPQFEAGPAALSRRGVVQREKDRLAALDRVLTAATACGLAPVGSIPSPIEGGDGNREYLTCFVRK